MPMTKETLRKKMKHVRKILQHQNPKAPEMLKDLLLVLLSGSQNIAAYYPMGTEISLLPTLQALQSSGKVFGLPYLCAEANVLQFRLWSLREPLQQNSFGFHEPLSHAKAFVPDVLLVPLLAFDKSRHRLGYGQGHYDRVLNLLRKEKGIITIGVGYEGQYLDYIPYESHDEILDYVVTEMHVYKDMDSL